MVACPTLAARCGMCASFLEIETVGLGPPAGLFRCQRPTVYENGLVPGELGVDPPVVGLVVCPGNQLPQSIAIGYEID